MRGPAGRRCCRALRRRGDRRYRSAERHRGFGKTKPRAHWTRGEAEWARREFPATFPSRASAPLLLLLLLARHFAHAGEIGLMDADPLSELHLRQLALAAELADLAAYELDLGGFCHLRTC